MVKFVNTGWSRKTETSNFSLTDLKITKNGVTQSFLESLYPTIYASSIHFMFSESLQNPGWIRPGGHYSAYRPFWGAQEGRIGPWRSQSTWYLCGQPRWTNRWNFGPNLASGCRLKTSGAPKRALWGQNGPFGIKTSFFEGSRNVLEAPEVLRQPTGAKFGPKCQGLVHLGWPHIYQELWPLQRPIRPSWGPQKGP